MFTRLKAFSFIITANVGFSHGVCLSAISNNTSLIADTASLPPAGSADADTVLQVSTNTGPSTLQFPQPSCSYGPIIPGTVC